MSIKLQLILFMTFVVTLVELGSLFVIYNLEIKDSKTQAIAETQTIKKSLENDLLKFILNPHADMLADLNYRLSAFKKITGFILYDDHNTAIFQYGDTQKIVASQQDILQKETLFTPQDLFATKKVHAEGYDFGYILMDIDLGDFIQKQEDIALIFLKLFPVALLLGFLLSLAISRNFTKPFEILLEAMRKHDPTKEKVSIQTHAKNEIKELFTDFNTQMDQIYLATKEIEALNKDIEDTQKEVVLTMGAIGETRSKETGNHVKRVAQYSKIFALHYGLGEEYAEMLKQASPMHDIGKVGIPDSILNKPGRFDEQERLIMDTHAQLGYDMLKTSNKPLLKLAATVAYEHHEKWNGSGYPNALKGEEIDISGRITAIADVFDALGSDRVYKKAWDDTRIFNLFKEERAKHFDPKLVDIFFDNLDEFLAVRETFKDVLSD